MGKWQVIDILNEGHPVVFINFHTESNASIMLQNSKTQMVAIFFSPKCHLCVFYSGLNAFPRRKGIKCYWNISKSVCNKALFNIFTK